MEENNTTVTTEGTTFQEGTHEETPETVDAVDTPINSNTADDENGSRENNSADDNNPIGEESESEFSLPITFNHEKKALTRDEAIKYAQMGMNLNESGLNLSEIKSIYNKLDFLAALNDTTIDNLIDGMMKRDEESYRDELEQRFGDDEDVINQLIALRKNEQKEKYNKILADRKTNAENEAEVKKVKLEERLAGEFFELQKEFPNVETFETLPREVKAMAAEGKDLTYAYMLYKKREQEKIDKAIADAEKNKKNTAGSLAGGSEIGESSETRALLEGLYKN